jgi:hypothetical protein
MRWGRGGMGLRMEGHHPLDCKIRALARTTVNYYVRTSSAGLISSIFVIPISPLLMRKDRVWLWGGGGGGYNCRLSGGRAEVFSLVFRSEPRPCCYPVKPPHAEVLNNPTPRSWQKVAHLTLTVLFLWSPPFRSCSCSLLPLPLKEAILDGCHGI